MDMKIRQIIYIAAIPALFASCESAFENKAIGDFEESDVWRIPDIAEGTLLTAYDAIPSLFDSFNGNFLDVATDNAVTNSFSSDVYKLSQAGVTAFNNPLGGWSNGYNQLQTVNLFMERGLGQEVNYDKTSVENDTAIKKRLRGECHFLRAWWHFFLLQRYGGRTDDGQALGIPLADHYITNEEAADLSRFYRNTYRECVDFIVADLDSAAVLLPVNYSGSTTATGVTNIGRATALAAKVLKTRVVLYGASPAYQPASVVQINGIGDFTVTDAAAYEQNWKYVAAVADSVIQSSGFGNFTALTAGLLADNTGNTPADFAFRSFGVNHTMETRHFPPMYYGSAQTQPSQNLVDAFPAKNGFPITDPRSGYDSSDPYALARDNRFNMDIYYNGSKFGTNSGVIDITYGGKDSPSFDNNATRTGYYLAKFLSRKDNVLTPNSELTTQHYTPILRKAEVFFNYAEASNEAYGPKGIGEGCKMSAFDVMKAVRSAYGITDVTYLEEQAADKDSFRKLIANERRIEFAFENQRFFDLRRLLLPINTPVNGVSAVRTDGKVVYEYAEVEERPFNDVRFYYMPLPYSELKKNSRMVNNMGWDNN